MSGNRERFLSFYWLWPDAKEETTYACLSTDLALYFHLRKRTMIFRNGFSIFLPKKKKKRNANNVALFYLNDTLGFFYFNLVFN